MSSSLDGQAEDLDALAEREDWNVVARFVDEGLSGGKRRANAQRALEMLANNEADVLAAYAVDRFSRQGLGEDAEIIRIVEQRAKESRRAGSCVAPARVIFIREGLDSAAGSDWRLRFGISSEMAHGELETMRARRRRAVRQHQSEGRYTGRGPEPWGYRSAPNEHGRGRTLVVDETEADIIREAAARLIAGETATSVARDFIDRGIPTPRSPRRVALLRAARSGVAHCPLLDPEGELLSAGNWSSSRIAQTLGNQYLLGRIVQKTSRSEYDGVSRDGELVRDANGEPLQAFPPVLDFTTFSALRERFAKGAGRGRQRVKRASRLLSGLMFCEAGGRPAYVTNARGRTFYKCSCQASDSSQQHTYRVDAEAAEAEATADYLATFGAVEAVETYREEVAPALTEALQRVTDDIIYTTSEMARPGADLSALVPRLQQLQQRRDDLSTQPAEVRIVTRSLGVTWGQLWATADVAIRRRYLTDAYDHFGLVPADGAAARLKPYVKPSYDEAPGYYDAVPTFPATRDV